MRKESKLAESAYSFAEQWPYLRYLGMGAWWGWIWLCYNSIELMRFLPEGQQPWYVAVMYSASTPGIAAVMLLAAVFWHRFTPLIEARKFVLASGGVASVATLLLGYSAFLGGTTTFIIAAMITGAGTSLLCLKMGQVYGSVALRESLTAGSVSLIFAAFLYFMGIGVPLDWRIAFIAALPFISALLFVMPGDDPFPATALARGEASGRHAPGRRSFWHLVMASALVTVTAGVGKGIASATLTMGQFTQIGSVTTFWIAVAALFIGLMVNRGNIVCASKRVYAALMLLGVAVLLASCFGLNLSYMGIGKEVLWMVFSCFMAYMVFRFDFSPVRAFGFGQAAYFIASTLSLVLGVYIGQNMSGQYATMLIAVAFAFVIVLIITFVFTDADLKFILTWKPGEKASGHKERRVAALLEPNGIGDCRDRGEASEGIIGMPIVGDGTMDAGFMDLHDLVGCIDIKYGLSKREREILELFAQGRSANWIADNLIISKNTVRSHLRAIYTKLDVHTRQELLDFLKGMRNRLL